MLAREGPIWKPIYGSLSRHHHPLPFLKPLAMYDIVVTTSNHLITSDMSTTHSKLFHGIKAYFLLTGSAD